MSFDDLVADVDRAVFDALGGEVVTYAPSVGSSVPVTGIFDANYVLANGDAHAGVETLGPAIFLRLTDLPVDPRDDEGVRLTIRGTVYRATERRPDSMGGIVLALRIVS